MKTQQAIIICNHSKPNLLSQAIINGRSFLDYHLDFLYYHQFKNIVFYINDDFLFIKNIYKNRYKNIQIQYLKGNETFKKAIEDSAELLPENSFYVLHAHLLFYADLWDMNDWLQEHPDCHFIQAFPYPSPPLEAAIFLIRKDFFSTKVFNLKAFNQEKAYHIEVKNEEKLQEFQTHFNSLDIQSLVKKIKKDKEYSLFLDRDGVINKRIKGNYVKYVEEFEFMEGSDDAIVKLSPFFKYIFVVTNQQGVGKNIMNVELLHDVHQHMKQCIVDKGGKIDAMYYCPKLAKNNPKCRKPNIGMALQAQKDFPDIDFNKAIMVGDSISDMHFGQLMQMTTVFVETKEPEEIKAAQKEFIHFTFDDLVAFASHF